MGMLAPPLRSKRPPRNTNIDQNNRRTGIPCRGIPCGCLDRNISVGALVGASLVGALVEIAPRPLPDRTGGTRNQGNSVGHLDAPH